MLILKLILKNKNISFKIKNILKNTCNYIFITEVSSDPKENRIVLVGYTYCVLFMVYRERLSIM